MKTIRARVTFVIISIIAVVILLSSFYQYGTQKKVTLEWSKDKATAEIRLLANDVSTVLKGVTRDLFMLRDFPQLMDFLDAKNIYNRNWILSEVEEFFFVFAQNKQIYDQVRFINERGMEVVRVNFDGKSAQAVKKGRLQDKSRRYYFEDSMSINFGNVYVSPMDLNIEHGAIEEPYKPMIRYATPVVDRKGRKRGIVILNVKAEYILNIIKEHQKRAGYGEKYYLLNRDGYYLLHPDERKEWGFMLGNDERLVNDKPELASLLGNHNQGFTVLYNDSLQRDYFYVYQRVYPITQESIYQTSAGSPEATEPSKEFFDPSQFYWVLLSSVDVQSLVPKLSGYTTSMILFSGALLATSIILASLFAWMHSRPIRSLSSTASRIANGDFSARANVSSQDEIGELGAVFNEMAEALQKRQEQEKNFQQRIRQEIVLAQERERRVLAQDIHDQLGQNLAIVRMKIQEAKTKLPQESSKLVGHLDESTALLKEMIQQTRTLIFDLYPIMLDDFGILRTIEWHVKEFYSRTGLKIKFIKEGAPGEPSRSRSVSIHILRVIKELLNNVLKHAEADEVVVTVHGSDSMFGIVVADDGKGFDPDNIFKSPHDFKGIGLFSIREWVSGLGGKFSIESKPDSGTRVFIEIPIEKKSQRALSESYIQRNNSYNS